MQSKVVESCFRSITAGLKNPKTLESMAAKYPVMKEALSKLPAGASVEDYMKGILSDPNGEEFLTKNLKDLPKITNVLEYIMINGKTNLKN